MESFIAAAGGTHRDQAPSVIPGEDVERILKYLELAPSTALPISPAAFLAEHIYALPQPLLAPFSIVAPRQRTSIPAIKSRRIAYAQRSPLPTLLTAESARLRWPLLWERLGGSSLPPPTADVEEEEAWVKEGFLPGQHVKRLGGFLRGLQEEREMEEVVHAKRAERRLDEQAEEFDSDSDDESPQQAAVRDRQLVMSGGEDQRVVKGQFEKKVMELFLDGLDTIDYDPIDFGESTEGDLLATMDDTERYFDNESPAPGPAPIERKSESNGVNHTAAAFSAISHDRRAGRSEALDGPNDMHLQNGSGEYDY